MLFPLPFPLVMHTTCSSASFRSVLHVTSMRPSLTILFQITAFAPSSNITTRTLPVFSLCFYTAHSTTNFIIVHLTVFLGWKIHWRRDRLPTPIFLGFPCGSAGKESACYAGDLILIPRLGRSPGEGKGYTLQYSGLEKSMNCIVRGVTRSRTRLSDFHFHSQRVMPSPR